MKKTRHKKRVITKILKLDNNNQYGYSMTKPLPTGFIKENSDISWRTFNLLLEKVNLDDQIGQLYVVDIEFDHKKATDNQIVYNEICPPNIEKQKIIDPCERYVYQVIEQFQQLKKVIHKNIEQVKKLKQLYSKKIL